MGEAEQRTDEDLCEGGEWSNQMEFLFAAAGSAICQGIVWRFPYLCFKNERGKDLQAEKY